MKELVQCPLCKREDERVLLRPHCSKKYHEFICGHCKIEFSFVRNEDDIEKQLKKALDDYLVKITGETMEAAVQRIMNTMSEEDMLNRLDELNQTYH